MTVGYRLLLATIQGVTAKMFTTTLRSQPVYPRSRLSEFCPRSRVRPVQRNGLRQCKGPRSHLGRWFCCLTGPPTYLYDATVPSYLFYAYAKWKARINFTPGR